MSNIITVVVGAKKILVNMALLNKAIKRMEMNRRNTINQEVADADRLARKDAFNVAHEVELNTNIA